jgi:hypothetical protein
MQVSYSIMLLFEPNSNPFLIHHFIPLLMLWLPKTLNHEITTRYITKHTHIGTRLYQTKASHFQIKIKIYNGIVSP